MMLTRVSPTNDYDEDAQLLNKLGLHPRVPFKDAPNAKTAGCARQLPQPFRRNEI